jgi:hypothetical protein
MNVPLPAPTLGDLLLETISVIFPKPVIQNKAVAVVAFMMTAAVERNVVWKDRVEYRNASLQLLLSVTWNS